MRGICVKPSYFRRARSAVVRATLQFARGVLFRVFSLHLQDIRVAIALEAKPSRSGQSAYSMYGEEQGGLHHRSVKDPTKKLSVVWWPRTTTIYRSLHFIALPSTSRLGRIRTHIYIRKNISLTRSHLANRAVGTRQSKNYR